MKLIFDYGDSGIYRFEVDSEVCLNGVSKINQYLNTAKQNKTQPVCIYEGLGAWRRYICHAWVITSHSKLGLYLPLIKIHISWNPFACRLFTNENGINVIFVSKHTSHGLKINRQYCSYHTITPLLKLTDTKLYAVCMHRNLPQAAI